MRQLIFRVLKGENESLETRLEQAVEQHAERHLQAEFSDFTPLVSVELLEPPE